MVVLEKIGFYQNRQDEVPNQELAHELAAANDRSGIAEIAENLWNRNNKIRSDCVKVLYEVGFLKPELIADYWQDFIKLLISRENRLVWGGMYALTCIAPLKADELFGHVHEIKKAMDNGSVITVDNGVKVLAGIAAAKPEYQASLIPYLLTHLGKCRTKEVPQHAESTLVAISGYYMDDYRSVLTRRLESMTPPQAARIKRILAKLT